MEIPEIHIIDKIHWQFFGTLTYRKVPKSERIRRKLLFKYLRLVAKQFEMPFDHLHWVVREEDGEATGRTHFHYLLAGLNRRCENRNTCFWLMDCWDKSMGIGHARVHRYDPRLGAGAYLVKELAGFNDRSLGGDFYESAKFSGPGCQLIIANTTRKVAARRSKRR